MKRKIVNLVLALVLLLSLGIIAAPVSADYTDCVVGYPGYTGDYDRGWVATDGDDLDDGTWSDPWATVAHALSELNANNPPFNGSDPDMIVLRKGSHTFDVAGGLVVKDPVVIVSYKGSCTTSLEYNGGLDYADAVFIVELSNVIIDGLELKNALTGVAALGPTAGYIENVDVVNCCIYTDEGGRDTSGIEMWAVKYPLIDNNNIYVGVDCDLSCPYVPCLNFGGNIGILLVDCFMAEVINNDVDVADPSRATGIWLDMSPKSMVGVDVTGGDAGNDVDVRADDNSKATGILVENGSHLTQINHNEVAATVEASGRVQGYGITVTDTREPDVIDNDVCVAVELINTSEPGTGDLMVRGITVDNCNDAEVKDNRVWVRGTADSIDLGDVAVPAELPGDVDNDLEDIAEIIVDILGRHPPNDFKLGTAIGIRIPDSDNALVSGNEVEAYLDLKVHSNGELDQNGGGAYSVGIAGLNSDDLVVEDNNAVYAESRLRVRTNVEAGRHCDDPEYISMALGIVLRRSDDGTVQRNDAEAFAYIDAEIDDYAGMCPTEGSALYMLDGIIGKISGSLNETMVSESVGIEHDRGLPGLDTGALCVANAIGIFATKSDDCDILDNPDAIGTADVDVLMAPEDNENVANGGGMGLGIGIAVLDCEGPLVSGNGAEDTVVGTGTANVTIVSGTLDAMLDEDTTRAIGGGAGVGIGILLLEDPNKLDSMESEAQGGGPCGRTAEVSFNNVEATGIANPVTVTAATDASESYAKARGIALAVAFGIAVDDYYRPLIKGNTVNEGAYAEANADIDSFAVTTYCPKSNGNATAVAVGISVTECCKPQILDNAPVLARAIATSDTRAEEDDEITLDARSRGGATGLGIGILVLKSPRGLVQGNSVIDDQECEIESGVVGLGHAECNVTADTSVPLNTAKARAMALGIGQGIAVICSPCTDVVRCNVAAGEGTANVSASATGDFDYEYAWGLASSTDIFMKLVRCCGPGYMEEDVDDQGRPMHRFGIVNYNSMLDPSDLGISSIGANDGPVDPLDAGLLKIGRPGLNAELNWWNHPTGPSGMGPGILGEPVLWEGPGSMGPLGGPSYMHHGVDFTPWLYVDHAEVLCEQVGKFGFFVNLCKGLNTFSTPIALDELVEPSREWGDIYDNSDLTGKILFIDRWDAENQQWVPDIEDDETIDPLDAYYIYSMSDSTNIILYVNSSAGHPYSMPTQEMYAGWNLIGPNPLWPDDGMRARHALSSVALTPDGLPGYTQVISPVVFCQDSWVFVPDMEGQGKKMRSGRGYWLWMENDEDILVGFGFSPLPAGP